MPTTCSSPLYRQRSLPLLLDYSTWLPAPQHLPSPPSSPGRQGNTGAFDLIHDVDLAAWYATTDAVRIPTRVRGVCGVFAGVWPAGAPDTAELIAQFDPRAGACQDPCAESDGGCACFLCFSLSSPLSSPLVLASTPLLLLFCPRRPPPTLHLSPPLLPAPGLQCCATSVKFTCLHRL